VVDGALPAGTGKTYTMEGGPRNSVDGQNLSAEAGVIPRAIKQIFDAIECNQESDSSVKVSFMELYNEELTDLLSPGDDKEKRLRLLEDRSGVVVQGLEEAVVKNAAGELSSQRCATVLVNSAVSDDGHAHARVANLGGCECYVSLRDTMLLSSKVRKQAMAASSLCAKCADNCTLDTVVSTTRQVVLLLVSLHSALIGVELHNSV